MEPWIIIAIIAWMFISICRDWVFNRRISKLEEKLIVRYNLKNSD